MTLQLGKEAVKAAWPVGKWAAREGLRAVLKLAAGGSENNLKEKDSSNSLTQATKPDKG